MEKYVTETEESLRDKLRRVERITNEEGIKLYEKDRIKYDFDHYSGEVKLVFVKQTSFSGGKLIHRMLDPLVKRLREIDRKWYVGIMVYGENRGKDETKVS